MGTDRRGRDALCQPVYRHRPGRCPQPQGRQLPRRHHSLWHGPAESRRVCMPQWRRRVGLRLQPEHHLRLRPHPSKRHRLCRPARRDDAAIGRAHHPSAGRRPLPRHLQPRQREGLRGILCGSLRRLWHQHRAHRHHPHGHDPHHLSRRQAPDAGVRHESRRAEPWRRPQDHHLQFAAAPRQRHHTGGLPHAQWMAEGAQGILLRPVLTPRSGKDIPPG